MSDKISETPAPEGAGRVTAVPPGGDGHGLQTAPPAADVVSRNHMILFWASFLTLIVSGVGFSVRAAILGDWSKQFGFTQTELGGITGGGLVGFGLTIIFFSFLADRVGYGPLMIIAFLLHFSSAVVTLLATPVFTAYGRDATYWTLYIGMFLFALGNGVCEAVINPLTATLFPRNKVHWLNILHAGWPGGLILGALLVLAFNYAGDIRWEIKMSLFLVPTLVYGLMMVGRRFPRSEASASGVTMPQMVQELGLLGAAVACALIGLWLATNVLPAFGVPGVIGWGLAVAALVVFGFFSQFRLGHWMLAFLLCIHALVGYVELGTDSWITNITGTILENPNYGLMLFIWTSGLMFIMRFFAGPIVHKISPLGLLFCSAVLGATGLTLLGNTTAAVLIVLAATVYGVGKTFFWPTMLGVVSERYPRGGALTLGMIGGVGMLSAGILGGPGIGYKQDYFASSNLETASSTTYDRYKSADTSHFLFFKPIKGLDGRKVGLLLGEEAKDAQGKKIPGSRQALADDRAAIEKSGRKPEDDKNYSELANWWHTEGAPHEEQDRKLVKDARLYGGQMALTLTAAVPVTMALCYLILILYFRARGGYQAQVLVGHAAHDEEFTGGVAGPAEL